MAVRTRTLIPRSPSLSLPKSQTYPGGKSGKIIIARMNRPTIHHLHLQSRSTLSIVCIEVIPIPMERSRGIQEPRPFVVSLSNHGRRGTCLFALRQACLRRGRQAQGERVKNLWIPDGVKGLPLERLAYREKRCRLFYTLSANRYTVSV